LGWKKKERRRNTMVWWMVDMYLHDGCVVGEVDGVMGKRIERGGSLFVAVYKIVQSILLSVKLLSKPTLTFPFRFEATFSSDFNQGFTSPAKKEFSNANKSDKACS
jgi:hypothetical protein